MQICICVNSCLIAKCERIKLSAIELINSHSKICSPSPARNFFLVSCLQFGGIATGPIGFGCNVAVCMKLCTTSWGIQCILMHMSTKLSCTRRWGMTNSFFKTYVVTSFWWLCQNIFFLTLWCVLQRLCPETWLDVTFQIAFQCCHHTALNAVMYNSKWDPMGIFVYWTIDEPYVGKQVMSGAVVIVVFTFGQKLFYRKCFFERCFVMIQSTFVWLKIFFFFSNKYTALNV